MRKIQNPLYILFISMLLVTFLSSFKKEDKNTKKIFEEKKLIYTYNETTENKTIKTIWHVEEKGKKFLLKGSDENGNTSLVCNDKFGIEKFSYQDNKEKTNYSITRKKNMLIADGTIKGEKKAAKVKIKGPWIQQFGFGLKPFVMSKDKKIKFSLLKPDDFSLQKMQATKGNIEKITIGKKTYDTINVQVSLQGFKSLFWKANLWFDTKTNDLVKYSANSGPNTPVTTITLVSIEKESFLKSL